MSKPKRATARPDLPATPPQVPAVDAVVPPGDLDLSNAPAAGRPINQADIKAVAPVEPVVAEAPVEQPPVKQPPVEQPPVDELAALAASGEEIPVGNDLPVGSDGEVLSLSPAVPTVVVHTLVSPLALSATPALGEIQSIPADDDTVSASGQYVTYVSRITDLLVNMGATKHRFEGGRLRVPVEHAPKFETHILYMQEHFARADEVVIVDGKQVSIKRHVERVSAAFKEKQKVFLCKEDPKLNIIFATKKGLETIRFEDGLCIADEDTAAIVRKHRLFIEGRVKEVEPALG